MTQVDKIRYALESGLYKTDEAGNVYTKKIQFSRGFRAGYVYDQENWRQVDKLDVRCGNRKRVWIDGGRVLAHRLVWALDRKVVPDSSIRIIHKDADELNNSPTNLLALTPDGAIAEPRPGVKVPAFQGILRGLATNFRSLIWDNIRVSQPSR